MKKLWFIFPSLWLLTACAPTTEESVTSQEQELKDVTLVLDYVPNTNHTGIYVAKDKGYYEEEGLNVEIIEPGDNATSIGLVGANKAQFGVSYQEDVTYAHANGQEIPITAIGTIIKHNTSGFVTAADNNITTPKDFENKTYAGWQSPSEEAILNAVMTNDGADFSKLTMVGSTGEGPEALGKSVDIQWYFEGWDLIKAKEAGIDLNYLPLRALDPDLDYYTPVLISNNDLIENDPATVQAFMDATKKGYQDAIDSPKESAQILHTYAPDYELDFLEESQAFLSANYTDQPTSWGVMEASVWDNYTNFMVENGLIEEPIAAKELYTNQFIE
ncbi:MAG: ABC transporter substrate-binding protein [Enterococcus sp.]